MAFTAHERPLQKASTIMFHFTTTTNNNTEKYLIQVSLVSDSLHNWRLILHHFGVSSSPVPRTLLRSRARKAGAQIRQSTLSPISGKSSHHCCMILASFFTNCNWDLLLKEKGTKRKSFFETWKGRKIVGATNNKLVTGIKAYSHFFEEMTSN